MRDTWDDSESTIADDAPVSIPQPTRRSPWQFDELMREQSRLSRMCGVPVDPLEAASIISGGNRRSVMTGTFVASSWAGRPRGHAPAVLIVADPTRAIARLKAAWPDTVASVEASNHLAAGKQTVSVRRGCTQLVELWTRQGDFLNRVCSTGRRIDGAQRVLATSREAEFALSCIGYADKTRDMSDRYEFAGGMYGIADNNPELSRRELIWLGVLWRANKSSIFIDFLDHVKSGKKLSFRV